MKKKEKQIRADLDFIKRLDEVKAKALLNNRHYSSNCEVTREMVRLPAWEEVERQLIENVNVVDKKLKGVRFDKKWF